MDVIGSVDHIYISHFELDILHRTLLSFAFHSLKPNIEDIFMSLVIPRYVYSTF